MPLPTLNINVNGLMKITRETKGVIFYNVIKIMAPLCTLVHLQSRLGHRDQRTSRSFPYFCSGKKSAPAYLGLQGWLISESSQSIHLTLPQNCQKGNFSSSERGELTIKTDPYKNSHLKSIFFFPLFLSQKTPPKSIKVFLIKMTRSDHTLAQS